MIRYSWLLAMVVAFSSTAHGRDLLTAYDAYFCPALNLTDEQKSELIPHIKKRQLANHGSKFEGRTDATVFGVDLSQTKASKDLAKPEDKAVRKILWGSAARELEKYLEETEDQVKRVKTNFPPLQGDFLGIQQEVNTSETGSTDLKITLDIMVPSEKYKLAMDEMTRDGETLIVKMSIIRPHSFLLMNDVPAPQKLSHEINIDSLLPKNISCSVREISEFDSEKEYSVELELSALQSSE